jgi:hypothetical protein
MQPLERSPAASYPPDISQRCRRGERRFADASAMPTNARVRTSVGAVASTSAGPSVVRAEIRPAGRLQRRSRPR